MIGQKRPRAAANACTLSLCVALAACSTINRDEVAAPANGGSVAMRFGTPLIVNLPPDPSTGYGWVLKSASPNLYPIGGPDYTPEPKPPGLVGVADTTTFRFRAKGLGAGTLEFAWQAPPGQPPAPERIVRYDVTVGPGLSEVLNEWFHTSSGPGQAPVKYWFF